MRVPEAVMMVMMTVAVIVRMPAAVMLVLMRR